MKVMNRFFCRAQDPVSCGTHAIGAAAAFAGGFLFLIRAVRGDYENGLFFCGAGVHRLEGMHSVAWLMKHWKTEWRAFA